MPYIVCPYCLELMEPVKERQGIKETYKCSKNKEEIPREYIEKKSIPRTTIGLVGYTGHGKTVYITSLFYLLKEMENKWSKDKYYLLCLDENTSDVLYNRVPQFKQGALPDSTPLNFPSPALILFKNIPYLGNYFVSFYDIGGGIFEKDKEIIEKGTFLAYSDTVFFIISIIDSGENWVNHIRGLLDRYIRTMYGQMGKALSKKQNLVVIFTKADSLNAQLSDELRNYLNNGTIEEYEESKIKDKINTLTNISKIMKKWLESKGCRGFISMAENNFKDVEYTLVSATGAAPAGKDMGFELNQNTPKRVLDPFLFGLGLTKKLGFWKKFVRG